MTVLGMNSAPKSAPGASAAELRAREQRIRRDLAAAEAKAAAEAMRDAVAKAAVHNLARQLCEEQQKLKECEADLKAYPIPKYLRHACRAGHVMVAVTGSAGVGKSSWINVARRVGPKDVTAASTGVMETTPEPQMYYFRRERSLYLYAFLRNRAMRDEQVKQNTKGKLLRGQFALPLKVGDEVSHNGSTKQVVEAQVAGILPECVSWDLPGVGTPKFPKETYLKDMGVRHFDMVVLMTAERFTEAELDLVKELKRWGVPYFLVRNKVDVAVASEIEKEEDSSFEGTLTDEHRKQVEAATIKSIKDHFKNDFGLEGVYCISARPRLVDQYDFRELEKEMEVALRKQRCV